MGTQLWTSGPVDAWVGLGLLTKGPVFLCHGEEAPDVEQVRYRKKVMTDQSGGRSGPPADTFALGADVLITLTAARHDMVAVQALLAEPNPFTGTFGKQKFGDRGTLLVAEGLTFPLWLRWPFSQKAAMAGAPNGVHFLACEVVGPDRIHSGMGELTEFSYVFYAHSIPDPNPANAGGWVCADFDMSAVLNLPIP